MNAEKSVEHVEYWIDLLTKPGDYVLDLYAGTASMGLACIKADRRYQGTETDVNVALAALLRLAKFSSAISRGDLATYKNLEYPHLYVNRLFIF